MIRQTYARIQHLESIFIPWAKNKNPREFIDNFLSIYKVKPPSQERTNR